ncbi:putative peroxisomal membrane protein pex16 [Phaeomoniella chlamydospora]|uniref:Putative peroxisomal membrane protein pex16 n=1 Tax=Phaeomoniella chlamydospora TaxID=158046 RepID=A0A0G2F231_PHACM|nr:putative peroxisomal membrane protein pex16 [Phaeomoniella chlamydospora]
MTTLERERLFVQGTLNEVFGRLLENDQANREAIEKLQSRVSRIDQLEAENARLRNEVENAINKNRITPSAELGETVEACQEERGYSPNSRKAYRQLEHRFEKIVHECEQLKVINNDLYNKLHNTQSKLRNWNEKFRPIFRNNLGNRSNASLPESPIPRGRHHRVCSPDLPAPRSAAARDHSDGTHESGQTEQAAGLEQEIPSSTASTCGGNNLIDDESSCSSASEIRADERRNLKRSHEDLETTAVLRSHKHLAGDTDDPVIIKSEPISSGCEVPDASPDVIHSSQTDDLNTTRQSPMSKRRKVHASSDVSNVSNVASIVRLDGDVEPNAVCGRMHDTHGISENNGALETDVDARHSSDNYRKAPSNLSTALTTPANSRYAARTPLSERDTNPKGFPRTSNTKTHLKQKPQCRSAVAIHHLAEDGDEAFLPRATSRSFESREERSVTHKSVGADSAVELPSFAHKRLEQLLTKSAKGRHPLWKPSLSPTPSVAVSPRRSNAPPPGLQRHGVDRETPALVNSETPARASAVSARARVLQDIVAEWKQALKQASSICTQKGQKPIKELLSATGYDERWFDEASKIIDKTHQRMPRRPGRHLFANVSINSVVEQDGSHTSNKTTNDAGDTRQSRRASEVPSSSRKETNKTMTPHLLPSKAPHQAPPTTVTPEDEPLRARPLNRLSLQDFKINAAVNDGLNYAYSDVVRGRSARKCLPGCTRPECCGTKFLTLASDLPSSTFLPTNPHSSTTDPDTALLLSYLSFPSTSSLDQFSPTERQTLLLQAKTKAAADKFGKMHRHAWQPQRQRSPPGFWRTDIPETQEMEENRRKAEEIEREVVEERWREAMKVGGRWMFRDE